MFSLATQLASVEPTEYVRFVADWIQRATKCIANGDPAEVLDEPNLTGNAIIDALVAAAAESVALDSAINIPQWTSAPERFVGSFWYPGPDALFAYALSNSRPEFKRHHVLIERDSLVSI